MVLLFAVDTAVISTGSHRQNRRTICEAEKQRDREDWRQRGSEFPVRQKAQSCESGFLNKTMSFRGDNVNRSAQIITEYDTCADFI